MSSLQYDTIEYTDFSHPRKPVRFQRDKMFYHWLFNDGSKPKNMNCWEAVLYAAFKAALRDKAFIKEAINFTEKGNKLVNHILTHPAGQYNKPPEELIQIPNEPIPNGHIVVFGDTGQHVAPSTGELEKGKHVILEVNRDTNGVTRSTIESVMRKKKSLSRKIELGATT